MSGAKIIAALTTVATIATLHTMRSQGATRGGGLLAAHSLTGMHPESQPPVHDSPH